MERFDTLRTVKNYAAMNNVTPTYIYKLAKAGKIGLVMIDGVKFVDIAKYPTIRG